MRTTRTCRATLLALWLVLTAGIPGEIASAQAPRSFSTWTTVPLRDGPNNIDIDGDGRPDVVFLALRDNFNAHSYHVVTFYRRGSTDNPAWQVVPFEDGLGVKSQLDGDAFRTHNGADCQLRGIALLRQPASTREPITVVVGERDFGQSYADTARVTFVVYRIVRNDAGTPGWPAVYFQPDRTIEAKSKYCDVNDAFATELGIRTRQ
jgi:Carbapenem resistance protein CarG-like